MKKNTKDAKPTAGQTGKDPVSRRDFIKSTSFAAAGLVLTPVILTACGGEEADPPPRKGGNAGGGSTGKPPAPAANKPSPAAGGGKITLVETADLVGDRGSVQFVTKTAKAEPEDYKRLADTDTDVALARKVNGGKGPFEEKKVTASRNGATGVANVLFAVQVAAGKKALRNTKAPVGVNVDFRITRTCVVGVDKTVTYDNLDPVTHVIAIKDEKTGTEASKKEVSGTGTKAPIVSNPIYDVGLYSVSCTMHNWEKAYVYCSDHAYAATTGSTYDPEAYRQGPVDGTVTIKDIPVGEHKVKVFHEGSEIKTITINVEKDKTAEVVVDIA